MINLTLINIVGLNRIGAVSSPELLILSGFALFGCLFCSNEPDFCVVCNVSLQVNPGSKAEKACLQPGDIIMEINGENTGDMLNVEAQNKIKSSKTQLQLLVER